MRSLTEHDQEGIGELFRAYGDAWQRRDAAGCAALYVADGDAIAVDGEVLTGRPAIERYYAKQLSGAYSGLTIADFEVDPARALAADVALQNATWLLHGFRTAAAGKEPVRVRATFLMSREGNKWRYAAARFMVPFEGET